MKVDNASTVKILCNNNIVSSYIVLDILIVASYFYCLYLFSKSETEYLLRLAENVSNIYFQVMHHIVIRPVHITRSGGYKVTFISTYYLTSISEPHWLHYNLFYTHTQVFRLASCIPRQYILCNRQSQYYTLL